MLAPREPEAMHLCHCIAFLEAKHSFHIVATHIRGSNNSLADTLSQDKLTTLYSLYPWARKEQVEITTCTAIGQDVVLDATILHRQWRSQGW